MPNQTNAQAKQPDAKRLAQINDGADSPTRNEKSHTEINRCGFIFCGLVLVFANLRDVVLTICVGSELAVLLVLLRFERVLL